MVGDCLHFAGWEGIEVEFLSGGRRDGDRMAAMGSLRSGLKSMDPFGVVSGTKR